MSPPSWEGLLAVGVGREDATAGPVVGGEQVIELGAWLSWNSGAWGAEEKGAVGSDQTSGPGLGARGQLSEGRDPTRRPSGRGWEPL